MSAATEVKIEQMTWMPRIALPYFTWFMEKIFRATYIDGGPEHVWSSDLKKVG